MDTMKLVVGQKIWLRSGDLLKEATVIEIGSSHMNVEPVGDEGKRFLQFRINGKPGTIFGNNKLPILLRPRLDARRRCPCSSRH